LFTSARITTLSTAIMIPDSVGRKPPPCRALCPPLLGLHVGIKKMLAIIMKVAGASVV